MSDRYGEYKDHINKSDIWLPTLDNGLKRHINVMPAGYNVGVYINIANTLEDKMIQAALSLKQLDDLIVMLCFARSQITKGKVEYNDETSTE